MTAESPTTSAIPPEASRDPTTHVRGCAVDPTDDHHGFIADIWYSIFRMVMAGALCGLCIVWGYNQAVADHSTRRWLGYTGSYAALLVGLGAVSFVVLDPQLTMAELMVSEDALAEVIPPALPLMIVASVVGTLVLWVLFTRARAAVIPILVAQVLLVFLVGHNLAILGLGEMSSDLLEVVGEFVGLTAFLGAGFAASVMLIGSVRSRIRVVEGRNRGTQSTWSRKRGSIVVTDSRGTMEARL